MKKIIEKIDTFIASVTLIFMTVIAFMNVVSRYVLHASLSFTDEITTNLFVLVAMAGASIAARNGKHLGLSLLTEILPAKPAICVEIIGNLLGTVFCALCTYLGILTMSQQIARNQLSPALRIPEAIYMSFLVIGMILVALSFLIRAVDDVKRIKDIKENQEVKEAV